MTSEVSYPVILQSMVKRTRMSKGRGRLISPAGEVWMFSGMTPFLCMEM
jgi:hypothetical protein